MKKSMERIVGKKIIAIIQAHMSSTRLPGKILKPLCGEPALYRMIERVRQSKLLDDIVIATSTLPGDDIIVQKCDEWGIHTFRGSDSDVLSRYWGAAQAYPADVYVRMTSDCPCEDSQLADRFIQYFLDNEYRYVSNAVNGEKGTVPLGFGCEVFEAGLLDEAYHNATEHFEHEHVTPYMYWKLPASELGMLPFDEDASMYRVTLDTQEDYEVISAVYKALYQPGNTFTVYDTLRFLKEHPEVAAINSMIVQKSAKD